MKKSAIALLLALAAALPALEIDLGKPRVSYGKYEVVTEGTEKSVKVFSSPNKTHSYANYGVPIEPFRKYVMTFEMRGKDITRRPSKSLFGGGVSLSAKGRIIYRGSQHGLWKHALGTFDWQKVVIKFTAPDTKEAYLNCELSDADGMVEFRRVVLEDVTSTQEKKEAERIQAEIRKTFTPVKVSGKVFEDANGNGKWDEGEKGIPGVQVSDGGRIVKTGADGSYVIPRALGRFIFVTKPDGYAFVGRHYAPLADKTDFAVKKTPSKDRTVFFSVNDSECGGADPFIGKVAAEAKKMQGDFLVHCGDIGSMKGHLDTMVKAGLPVHYVIGNHDFHRSKKGGEEPFETLFGPLYYAFDQGGIHYVIVAYFVGVDVRPSPHVEPRQLEWLKQDFAMNPGPKIVFRHHPFTRFDDAVTKMVLDPKNNVIATVSGHTHATQTRIVNGIITTECAPPQQGPVDHSPKGFLCGVCENGRIVFTVCNNVDWTSKPAVDKQAEPVAPAGDWAQFRRTAARDGISSSPLKTPLRLRWKVRAPGRIYASSPVLCGGRVYIASLDDAMAKDGAVCAFDVRDGKLCWKTVIGPSVKHTLACDGKRVYGAAVDGTAFALDAADGKLLWRTVIPYFNRKSDGLYGPATLHEGRLWVGGDHLTELDPATGRILREDDKLNHGSPCHAGAVIADGKIFSSENWRQGVYAHDLASGRRLWRTGRDNGAYTFLDSGPAFADGKLYQKTRTSLRILDPATGKCEVKYDLKRKRPPMESFSMPLVADGKVFFGTALGLFACDAKTLAPLWTFKPGKEMISSIPYSWNELPAVHSSCAWADGKVIFGGGDGFLYVLSASDGKVLYSLDLGASVYSSPAVSGNTVVIAAADGTVYAFTGTK
ncbi:MAG: PQQ-binding-like beta-propeller repeat protein [Lentisphaeria bacterium]|nr:PQQ-binding-like beta-propeller repeat protein [Lentisphaeria bacterium]